MTTSTSVHSNAFNFMSYLQSGVDPRTGQYTVSITLPEVKTNGLRGPTLPLVLSYNPLNVQDSGFGFGWNLQLSQYEPGSQIVSLSSGETFKVQGISGDQLLM
ncbi:YD repeat-containing protein, partial [Pseudomonas syringae pv. actinidiae str. M302091]